MITGSMQSAEEKTGGNVIVPDGCYYLRYIPASISRDVLFFEGTLRVLRVDAYNLPHPMGRLRAGGDLYCRWRDLPYGRDENNWEKKRKDPAFQPEMIPDLGEGIPIFPRIDYRYYLEVTQILEVSQVEGQSEGFTARFKVHEYSRNSGWPNPGTRAVVMIRAQNPSGVARRTYFSGKLMDEDSGQVIGTITMERVSDYLREAYLLVDREKGVQERESVKKPCTLDEWKKAFSDAKWDLKVKNREVSLKNGPASKEGWTVSELHNAMLQAKDLFIATYQKQSAAEKEKMRQQPSREEETEVKWVEVDLSKTLPAADPNAFDFLDKVWFYHLLCVGTIKDFDRGVMYDTYGIDSNNVPREGAAIACKWKFDPIDRWGDAKGLLQDEPRALRRVAVHELGHAMGLDHNHKDLGYMNTTDTIADAASSEFQKWDTEAKAARQKATEQMIIETFASAEDLLPEGKKPRSLDFSALAAQARQIRTSADKKAEEAEGRAKLARFPLNINPQFHPEDLERLRFGPDVTVRPGGEFDEGGPYFDKQYEPAKGLKLEVLPLLEAVPLGAPVRIAVNLINTSDRNIVVPEDLSLNSGLLYGFVIDPEGVRRSFWPLKKCVDLEAKRELKPRGSITASITLLRGAQGALFPRSGTHTIIVTAAWDSSEANLSISGETQVYITPAVDDAHRAVALKVLSTPDTLLTLAIGGAHLNEGRAAVAAALQNEVLAPHFAIIQIKEEAAHGNVHASLCQESSVLGFSEVERVIMLLRKPGAKKKFSEYQLEGLQQRLQKLFAYCNLDPEAYTTLKNRLTDLQEVPLGVRD